MTDRPALQPVPVRVDDPPPPVTQADLAGGGVAPSDAAAGPTADAALVARVAAGDAEALGTLYDRFGADAHRFARVLVGGAADEADDVTAAVFAQLWRTAARYDAARGSVAAWVTMVTRARALDHVRARRRRVRLEERAAGDAAALAPAGTAATAVPLGGSPEAPDAAVERAEAARAVRGSLAALPEPQRRAIELAFFGGLSHADVAAALGQPLGTVKTRIRTGLLKLREAMRPAAAAGGDA